MIPSVLHSFPHRLGMHRICTTAWYEIASASNAGATLHAICGDSVRPLPPNIRLTKTLAAGRIHIPRKLIGVVRLCALHDWMVARHLLNQTESYNVVHTWPLATLRTAKAAKQFGIPVALERCNAHTRYAYNSVKEECDRIGIHLPRNFEHQKNTKILSLEESEYESASIILCPSDFVVKTFLAEGFPINKLKRFFYGVDTSLFYPQATNSNENSPLTVLFVGICAVRKGLHIALRAWIESEASRNGRFIIAGNFLPEYQRLLTPLLKHPSISILGHRSDIPHLMRNSDVFILPSVEEGFGLVCTEAIASGCVPLVSQACTDLCQHRHNSLVHPIGDIELLSAQLTLLYRDRDLLKTLRQNGIAERSRLSWESAGRHLRKVYNDISH